MTLTQTEFLGELLFDATRQREVEILASEQEVLADGGAFKFDVSALDVGLYQAELRCRKSARSRRLAGALRERSDAPPPTRKRQPTALPAESGFAVLPLAPLPPSALELPRRTKPARLVRFPGSRRAVADWWLPRPSSRGSKRSADA